MARLYGQQEEPYGPSLRGEPNPRKKDPHPTTKEVEDLHKNAEVDVKAESIHHTLGPGEHQASPGSHNHDGTTSKLLLEGFTLTGNKATPATVFPSIIQCLVRLGATDSTT